MASSSKVIDFFLIFLTMGCWIAVSNGEGELAFKLFVFVTVNSGEPKEKILAEYLKYHFLLS